MPVVPQSHHVPHHQEIVLVTTGYVNQTPQQSLPPLPGPHSNEEQIQLASLPGPHSNDFQNNTTEFQSMKKQFIEAPVASVIVPKTNHIPASANPVEPGNNLTVLTNCLPTTTNNNTDKVPEQTQSTLNLIQSKN